MNRDIHDIYDVILKIIAIVYGSIFLNYIGIEKEMKKELKTEITSMSGNKFHLDFLCELRNGTLQHIEFQFPEASPDDLDRFFNYNILSQARYQKLTETKIVNYTLSRTKGKIRQIGKTKCFNPEYFYLGDIDFEKEIKKINIKVKSERQLSNCDEITLMLWGILPNNEDKAKKLKKICKLLKKRELFDESKFEFIKAIIKLEMDNFLTKEERKEIKEEIIMSPQALNTIQQAIDEVNKKVISEAKIDAKIEGIKEGREEGKEEGREEAMKEFARKFKTQIDLQELSAFTGLSIDEIKNL